MTRDAKKQSVACKNHLWTKTAIFNNYEQRHSTERVACKRCGVNPKAKDMDRVTAILDLRDILKPGMTIYTTLRHVSRSGMQRVIDLHIIEDNEPRWIGYTVARATERRYDDRKQGLVIGGCGMDMGFHVVHNLGYALFGREAQEGTDADATKLRKALLQADRFYFTQGGTPEPDPSKPDRLWFGGAGYALKHKWL